MKLDREFKVEVMQNWSRGVCDFYHIKDRLGFRGPLEQVIFSYKIDQRQNDGRISLNETSIVIDKAKKDLNIINRLRNRSFSDDRDAFRIYRDFFRWDDIAQEGN